MGFRDSLGLRHKAKSPQTSASATTPSSATPTSPSSRSSQTITVPAVAPSSTSPAAAASSSAVASNVTTISAATGTSVQAQSSAENQVLKKAIEKHLAQLPEAEKDVFKLAARQMSEDTILDQVKFYDDSHRNKSLFRPRTETISRAFHFLQRFLDAIAIGIQANPDISSIVVGCARAVITIAIGFVEFFERLTDMIAHLSDYLDPLATYAKSSHISGVVENCLVDVYIDILSFFCSARRVFVDTRNNVRKYTTWRVFWMTQWLPFEHRFDPIEKRMQHHLDVLKLATHATSLETSVALTRGEQERSERESAREREELLRWLSSHRFEDIHAKTHGKKHPGTGDWLIYRPEFEMWMGDSDSTILWCHGKPGAGKSVLASNVIEYVTSQCLLGRQTGVAFAYCSYQDPNTQDISFILTAFIQQLCQQRRDFPKVFLSVKQDGKSASRLANVESFEKTLEVLRFEKVFLVIDALDECPKTQRVAIMKTLREIQSLGVHVKIFLTSRGETDIYEAIRQTKAPYISIEVESVQPDIRRYVTEETQRLIRGVDGRKLNVTNPLLQERVIETLTTKAEGMFLWVNLQLLNLCEASESYNDRDVEHALTMLPSGLDATYERSLDHILNSRPDRQQLAFRLFRWVIYTNRVMTVEEIRDLLSFEDPHFDRKTPLAFLLSVCANLLEVPGSSLILDGPSASNQTRDVIVPIHYSVKEFITTTRKLQMPSMLLNDPHDLCQIHTAVATTCVGFLVSVLENAEPCGTVIVLRDLLGGHPFLDYAARNFDEHLARSDKHPDLVARVRDMLQLSDTFAVWLMNIRDRSPQGLYVDPVERKVDMVSVIFATKLYDMTEFDSSWKSHPPDPATFHLACSSGHGRAVSHFLDQGAVVEAVGARGSRAIHFAAREEHTEIIRILLHHGADVNAASVGHSHPLIIASARGDRDTVQLLLEHGVNLDVQGDRGSSALSTAVVFPPRHRRRAVAQLLLDRGANVNQKGGPFDNSLQAACYHGDLGTVQLLLDAGADINARGGEFGTPLRATVLSHIGYNDRILEEALEAMGMPGAGVRFVKYPRKVRNLGEIIAIMLNAPATVIARGGGGAAGAGQRDRAAGFVQRQAIVRLLLDKGAVIDGDVAEEEDDVDD